MKKTLFVLLLVMVLAINVVSAQICVEDTEECVEPPEQDVPEFGTVGAGIALAGAVGFSVFKRRKK